MYTNLCLSVQATDGSFVELGNRIVASMYDTVDSYCDLFCVEYK